jgi:hypothetical protein
VVEISPRDVITGLGIAGAIVGLYVRNEVRVSALEESRDAHAERLEALEEAAKAQQATKTAVEVLATKFDGIDEKVCGVSDRVDTLDQTVRGGLDTVISEVRKLHGPQGAAVPKEAR